VICFLYITRGTSVEHGRGVGARRPSRVAEGATVSESTDTLVIGRMTVDG